MIELAKIRTDGGTQSRAAINEETVAEYAEAMRQPETVFPPVIVYYDGREYWLADGFHRVEAWREVGRIEVPAEVRQGDRRQAILHSCGANAAHGLRRTNADKKRAVWTLLEDPEWSQWSDREIARRVRVHHGTVAKYREEISGVYLDKSPDSHERKVERGGTTYTQNTANIGGQKPDAATAPPDARAEERPRDYPEPACWPKDSYSPAPAPEPDPEDAATAKLRAEARKLTREALEEDWISLRQGAEEYRARIGQLRSEVSDLSAQIKVLTDGDDSGRKIGALMRQLDQAKGRSAEYQANAARLQKQVNAQAAEIKKLRRELEQQEVPL